MIKVSAERLCDEPFRMNHPISASDIINSITYYAEQAGLHVLVKEDSIKAGGGLLTKAESCIAIYNADHIRDYYSYILVQRAHANFTYLYVYLGGDSKNYKKELISNNTRGLIGMLSKPSHKKQADESAYYDLIKAIIAEAVSSCM